MYLMSLDFSRKQHLKRRTYAKMHFSNLGFSLFMSFFSLQRCGIHVPRDNCRSVIIVQPFTADTGHTVDKLVEKKRLCHEHEFASGGCRLAGRQSWSVTVTRWWWGPAAAASTVTAPGGRDIRCCAVTCPSITTAPVTHSQADGACSWTAGTQGTFN